MLNSIMAVRKCDFTKAAFAVIVQILCMFPITVTSGISIQIKFNAVVFIAIKEKYFWVGSEKKQA